MTKLTVTETFTRVYELEVTSLDKDTIQSAIDAYDADTGPTWVGTCVTDNEGSEVLEY